MDVAHRTQARLVRHRAVVHDSDLVIRSSGGPVEEMRGELVVCDDYIFINRPGGFDVVDQPVKDGFVLDFQ